MKWISAALLMMVIMTSSVEARKSSKHGTGGSKHSKHSKCVGEPTPAPAATVPSTAAAAAATPATTTRPATVPPTTNQPATEPPTTTPPATEPPTTSPPATEPPTTAPPGTSPPITAQQAAVTTASVTDPCDQFCILQQQSCSKRDISKRITLSVRDTPPQNVESIQIPILLKPCASHSECSLGSCCCPKCGGGGFACTIDNRTTQ